MQRLETTIILGWFKKFSASLTDQFVYSGANFFLNVLLARWLLAAEFGGFGVSYSIFIMSTSFYNAFILEPLILFGSTTYKSQLRSYLQILVLLHFGITGLISAVIIAGTQLFLPASSMLLRQALTAAAISLPFVLLSWLFRRIFYVEMKPRYASLTSVTYAVILLGSLALFHSRDMLYVGSGYWALGLAGSSATGVALLFLWKLGRNGIGENSTASRPGLGEVCRLHWNYGKWFFNSAAVNWLTDIFYTPLLGTLSGLEAAGAYQAIQTLLQPVQQIRTAASTLLVPWFSSRVAQDMGKRNVHRAGWLLSLASVLLSGGYGLLLFLARRPLVRLVYQNEFYESYSWLIVLFVIGSLARSVVIGPSIMLRALSLSKYIFTAQAVSAFVTITVGILLVKYFGITGAAWGYFLSNIALGLAYVYIYVSKVQA
jgi:O-antigen/teichoic acid export membrane protein